MIYYPSILIVDDDEEDRHSLEKAFHTNNFHDLGIFADGNSLFSYLATEAKILPKLIVSDYSMPAVSGLDLLTKVKRANQLKDIHVIILSSTNGERQVKDCMTSGATGFYVKPASDAEICRIAKIFTGYATATL